MNFLFGDSVQFLTFRFADTQLHKQLILHHLTVQLNTLVLCLSRRIYIFGRRVLPSIFFVMTSTRCFVTQVIISYITASIYVCWILDKMSSRWLQSISCWQPWCYLVSFATRIARHSKQVRFNIYIFSCKFCVCYKHYGVLK